MRDYVLSESRRISGVLSILPQMAVALAYRKVLARRPDWNREIRVAVVEVCGNTGCNWFDLQCR